MRDKMKVSSKRIWPTLLVIIALITIFAGITIRFLNVSGDVLMRRKFHNLVTSTLKNAHFSGTALIAFGEKIVYIEAVGEANSEEETRVDTIYPIFSLTKQFTGYMIGCLENEGKISRTDKLSKFFPECNYGDDVTVADLLTMTSGIPEYVGNKDIWGEDESYKTAGTDQKKLTDAILGLSLESREYNYSNSNYYLLGCIIEKVSGLSYEDNFNKYIVKKSGVKTIGFDPQAAESLGHFYNENIRDGKEYHKTITFGAGNLCTTISNLYQWQRFLYSDEADFSIVDNRDSSLEYDYGTLKNGNIISHTGGGIYHRHFMGYDMENDIQLILLNNESTLESQEMAKEIYSYSVAYKGDIEKEEQKNVE